MIQEAIGILVDGCDLAESQAADVMTDIMGGAATSSQIGAFVTALRITG
jgi:anthranilate phosphoribosyltransferase